MPCGIVNFADAVCGILPLGYTPLNTLMLVLVNRGALPFYVDSKRVNEYFRHRIAVFTPANLTTA
jgi:hypothetical protein